MKAVSRTLWIITTAVVVIIVAMVILGIFTGGMSNINKIIIDWIANVSASFKGVPAIGK